MNSDQFSYWLQGFVELHGEVPTEEQWQAIKEHLQTVFIKVTPPVYSPMKQWDWGVGTGTVEAYNEKLIC